MSAAPAGMPSLDFDPFAPEVLADPYAHHARLRDAGTAVWLPKYRIVGVARFAQVQAVLEDPVTFCSGRGVGLADFATETPWRAPSIILEADPPLHTRTRGVLADALSRASLAKLAPAFEARAAELVRTALERKNIDGITDLATAYPLAVFPDAIGVAPQGRENLLPYGDMAFNAFGPRNDLFEASFANAAPVAAWIAAQCRREELAPDSIGAHVYAAVDAGIVSAGEAELLVRSLLTAGLDTTIYGIGAALYCLAQHPSQWALLKAEPRLARAAFTEVVRLLSPAQTFFRTATRPTAIAGLPIAEGQKILLFLAAANRDPRQWEKPDEFDIRRRVGAHVGFGYGIHTCVGQAIARLETEALLRALARDVTAIELNGTPEPRINNTLHGFGRLPLTLT